VATAEAMVAAIADNTYKSLWGVDAWPVFSMAGAACP